MFRLRRDDVPFLAAVEMGYALETHVVGFGGARGEYDAAGVGADEGGDLCAGMFDRFFGFPAVGVGAGMGVAVEGGEVGEHFVEDAGVGGSGCLGVEVDGAGSVFENGGFIHEGLKLEILCLQERDNTSRGGEKSISFDGDFCCVEGFCWCGERPSGKETEGSTWYMCLCCLSEETCCSRKTPWDHRVQQRRGNEVRSQTVSYLRSKMDD